MIAIKRVYEVPAASDGYRVLVDRLWPRGLTKERAAVDEWLKDIAPSNELRQWFGHKPERFDEFCKRYLVELSGNPAVARLKDLVKKYKPVTLLFAAHDVDLNQARVLRDYLAK